MATMSEGVVERANTILENRRVLSELIRRKEFLEPSQKELFKLFTRLNADNARELIKDMKSFPPAWDSKKITDRLYGPVPGIPCGSWWGIRMDCSRDRMHDPFSASVQGGPVGAISICTSHSNEDVDLGDMLTFTGQSYDGDGDEDEHLGRLAGDKEQSQENQSLILNFKNRVPVRIIRSYNLSNEYSPKTGYRYDGLYMVVDYWIGVSPQTSTRCYKFALKRLFHQEPPPWKKIQTPCDRLESVPALERYSKNCKLLGRGGISSRNHNTNVHNNDTIISPCISFRRFQNRDGKTPKVIRSAHKRRPRRNETSSEPEGTQSASNSKGPLVSPDRKIVSTDHRNVHVSAIVTRRVSKKLTNNITDNKSLPDCAVNKSWNVVGGSESQTLCNDGEEEGAKSQNTRLQNTNISIRTDLYDSSHNLKQHSKKCGSNVTHGTGIFKPRILGIPRRELNFAGVDSSPGSSRAISSVKMERVKSLDTQLKQRNLHHILYQEKDKAANGMTDMLSKNSQSSKTNVDLPRDADAATSPSISRTFASVINDSCIKNKDLEGLETTKTKCLHRIEHSYASQCLKSITRKGNSQNLVNQMTNSKEEVNKTGELDVGGTKDGEKTEFSKPEAARSSETLSIEADPNEMGEKSLRQSSPVISPSQSPLFKGFRSSERSKNRTAESSWLDTSILMNSLTIEKMLDIIAEEKSSPMAKMLISNVIGFPPFGSSPVFDQTTKTDSQIEIVESRMNCEIKKKPSSMRTRSWGRQAAVELRKTEISSTLDLQNLKKSNSRQLRRFENSTEQKIIEIVYAGEEPHAIQRSVETSSDSHNAEDHVPVVDRKSEEIEASTSQLATMAKTRETNDTSNKNFIQASKQSKAMDKYPITRHKSDHESRYKEKQKDVFLRLRDSPDRGGERNARISEPQDTIDLWNSKPTGSSTEHCDSGKNATRERSRLTIERGRKTANSWKRNDPLLKKDEFLKPDFLGFPTSSASQTTSKTPKTAQIITRSKYLQNSIRGSNTNSKILGQQVVASLKLNSTEWNQSLKDPDDKPISCENQAHNPTSTLGLRSTGRVQQSENKVADKLSKSFNVDLKRVNSANREGSKSKSPDKMRLLKRSGVRVKRKMEVANLFIDMNMSPRSQRSKAKSRSRRSLRGANHSRRRSCPAVVDRALKRRNEDPVKHPTSPLKRTKKSVQIQSSSVQISNRVAPKKGLSLRKKTKNRASPLSNNNNNNTNNNNNNNSVKRIGKAEKVIIAKIKKPMTSTGRNLVAKKNTVNGLRAPAEIPKRTRSGRSPRSLGTVGRLGLRRVPLLLSSTETYARKKKMKMEKQQQKRKRNQPAETVKKQPPAKKKLIEFKQGLNKAKLDCNVHTGTSHAKKPKMVSVMTQCSLIPIPPERSASLVANHRETRENNDAESPTYGNTGYPVQGSDSGSGCIYSPRNSDDDQIKNEIIELIEIKSEAIDDDVINCDDEDNETEEVRVRINPNSAFNKAAIRLKNHQTIRTFEKSDIQGLRFHSKNRTSSLRRLSQGLGVFSNRGSGDSAPRKGFIPYVAEHRPCAFIPVKSVEGNLTLNQLKSIGFKPIKPGVFPPNGSEDGSKFGRRSTSDSPRIAYSSAVVKRGVHEEYDKYTSEENNVVQYMDSRLCYEDIENEDIVSGSYAEPGFDDMFVEKMEFIKLGTEVEEESNDNSFLQGGNEEGEDKEEEEKEDEEEEEGEEEEEEEEERAEVEEEEEEDEEEEQQQGAKEEEEEENEVDDLEKRDIKEWQSQLDENSSSSENTEQDAVDSDGDVPWHGWRKIVSNKKTHFVGW